MGGDGGDTEFRATSVLVLINILTKFLTVIIIIIINHAAIIICSVDLSQTAQHIFTPLLNITASHLIKHSHSMWFVAVC